MEIYDLRSDTITKPSEGMRRAMYEAEVGDDVYGEDPTIGELEEHVNGLTGKEASLFVPSGSMGNLIPLYLLCDRGDEVLTHEKSHIRHYELSSVAALAGVLPVPVPGARGILTPENLSPLLRADIYYMARTKMIELENTHNLEGGTFYRRSELEAVYAFAREHDLSIHMDGARVFNAAIASGLTVKEISSFSHTLTFCLSKGLGAPVGAMLCGDKPFITEARRVRKMLGGGMRQAGILAAAGLFALRNHVELLKLDHQKARELYRLLKESPWVEKCAEPETNILFVQTKGKIASQVAAVLVEQGVKVGVAGEDTLRMVTSLAVPGEAVRGIGAIFKEIDLP